MIGITYTDLGWVAHIIPVACARFLIVMLVFTSIANIPYLALPGLSVVNERS